MKLKFSSYVHLLAIKQILQYRQARVILCNVSTCTCLHFWARALYLSFGINEQLNVSLLLLSPFSKLASYYTPISDYIAVNCDRSIWQLV